MKKTNSLLRGLTFLLCCLSISTFAQTYEGIGGTIPDDSCPDGPEFFIEVSNVSGNNDLAEVALSISHAWDEDLDIYLVAPDGTSVELSTDNGGSDDNYTNTQFRDDAAISITAGSAPFTGAFQPEQPLSTVAGQTDGTWTLQVCDDEFVFGGTLLSWSLTFGGNSNNNNGNNGNCFPSVPRLSCGDQVSGDTTLSSVEESLPFCGTSLNTAPGNWYIFAGTGDVINITASTAGSEFDTKLGVFTGNCDALSCVGGNDDGGPGLTSEVSFNTQPGQDYYIYVTGFSTSAGVYNLSVSCQLQADIEQDCITAYNGYCPEISVEASYGESPYSYLWSDGSTSDTVTACVNQNTVYSVTITDSSGNTATDEIIVVYSPEDVSCSGDKVMMCHNKGNGQIDTICVASTSVQSHLAHGDTIGSCDVMYYTCNTIPGCASITTPLDGAVGVELPVTLEWTGLGLVDGYILSVGTASGGSDIIDGLDVGLSTSYTLNNLDYLTVYYVSIIAYNGNGNAESCQEISFKTQELPVVDVECGTPVNTTHCYGDLDSTVFAFQSTDESPLEIVFNSGTIESCCDDIIIYDGLTTDDPVLYSGNNGGNLSGLSVHGTGDSLLMVIDSDFSISCASGSRTTWDFDVDCYDAPEPIVCTTSRTYTGYIYTNGVTEEFTYTSTDGSRVYVEFLSGRTENGFDELIVIDSDGATIYTGYGNNGDLAGLTFASIGDSITIKVTPDGSVNSSLSNPWNYNVSWDCSGLPEPPCLNRTVINSYTYTNGLTENFTYTSTDGSQVYVQFSSGRTENNYDELIVIDSDGAIIYTGYGNSGNLAGLEFISSGDNITIRVTPDGSVNSSSSNPWNYNVSWTCTGDGFNAPRYSPEINSNTSNTPLDWSMAPNPTKGNVTLNLSNYLQSDVTIDVLNVTGKVIYNTSIRNLQGSRYDVELNSGLPAGMYFVRVAANGQVSTKKLMIMH